MSLFVWLERSLNRNGSRQRHTLAISLQHVSFADGEERQRSTLMQRLPIIDHRHMDVLDKKDNEVPHKKKKRVRAFKQMHAFNRAAWQLHFRQGAVLLLL